MISEIKRQIPNVLSILRILLIIPFIDALAHEDTLLMALFAALIILADVLDGLLARTWNVVSTAGKILDPLADKICFAAVAVALIRFRGFPVWLLAMIVIRDVLILIAGAILMKLRQIVPISNVSGKISTIFMSIAMLIYLFRIETLKTPAALLSALLLVISLLSYALYFSKSMSPK